MPILFTLVALISFLANDAVARVAVSQETTAGLSAGKIVLAYERLDRDHLIASISTADGSTRHFLKADDVVVDRLVQRLLGSLTPVQATTTSIDDLPIFDADAAHRLFQILIQPLMADLSQASRLAILAEGTLSSLPFETLLTTRPSLELQKAEAYRDYPWLRRSFVISRLTKTARSLDARDDQLRTDGGLLGFGNPMVDLDPAFEMPALPEANLELALLRMSLHGRPGRIAVGAEASEAHLKAALETTDRLAVLALATHGIKVRGQKDDAVLMLSRGAGEDGFLTAEDVRAMRFRADLVILSACDSAALPLVEAFIAAGGQRVLALRWPVLSNVARQISATVVAMTQRDTNLPHDVALQLALDRLLEGGASSHYNHPMIWAPFVLTAATA